MTDAEIVRAMLAAQDLSLSPDEIDYMIGVYPMVCSAVRTLYSPEYLVDDLLPIQVPVFEGF